MEFVVKDELADPADRPSTTGLQQWEVNLK